MGAADAGKGFGSGAIAGGGGTKATAGGGGAAELDSMIVVGTKAGGGD